MGSFIKDRSYPCTSCKVGYMTLKLNWLHCPVCQHSEKKEEERQDPQFCCGVFKYWDDQEKLNKCNYCGKKDNKKNDK